MKSSTSERTKPLLLIFGPTAVGKTDLIAHLMSDKAEMISADSMQVYRYLDIGTAKPSSHEQEKIRHHLINILNPDEQFHAGQFVEAADRCVEEIRLRGNLPVISGGTGYYFRNFLFGLPEVPPTDSAVADMLRLRIEGGERDAMFRELQSADPVSADKIHINDSYRLVRALEVYKSSGRPLSSYEVSQEVRAGLTPVIIGLNRNRQELYDRINQRVDLMFKRGLATEVSTLIRMGYDAESPGMKGIGYREFFEASEAGHEWDLDWIAERVKRNSRHYAKKQLTYFKLIPEVNWFNPGDPATIREFILSRGIDL